MFYRTPLEDCFWLVRLWHIHISGQLLNQRNYSLSFFFLINSCIDRLSLVHWFLYKLFCTALICNNHRWTYCQNELLMDYYVSKSPSIFIFSQELISKLHSLGKRFKQIFWEFFQRCHLVIYIIGNSLWFSVICVIFATSVLFSVKHKPARNMLNML